MARIERECGAVWLRSQNGGLPHPGPVASSTYVRASKYSMRVGVACDVDLEKYRARTGVEHSDEVMWALQEIKGRSCLEGICICWHYVTEKALHTKKRAKTINARSATNSSPPTSTGGNYSLFCCNAATCCYPSISIMWFRYHTARCGLARQGAV
jgi:hypothetical protein